MVTVACMNVILTHDSSLHIIAHAAATGVPLSKATWPASFGAPNEGDLKRIQELLPYLNQPYDFLSSSDKDRRTHPFVKNHVMSQRLPGACLRKVADGVYIVSPELAFIQKANDLTDFDSILLGYALMGTYGLCDFGWNDKLLDMRRPFMTQSQLNSALDKVQGIRGSKKARRISKYLMPESASPAETRFGMSMTMPRRLGGLAQKDLMLNYEIPLTQAQQKIAGKESYHVDLFDPRTNIGFEYLGEESHNGMIRGVKDLRRESILQSLGIPIHGVTKTQARNLMELIRFAKIISRARGEEFRKPTPEQVHKMLALLNYLYSRYPRR